MDAAQPQWRAIHLQKLDETTNTMAFWAEVKKHRDAADKNPYEDLASAVVSGLSLPHSNAEVERLFSQMVVIKTKLGNILYIRYGLKLAGDACYEHKLPDKVLQQFGTSAAYSFQSCPAAGSSSSCASRASVLALSWSRLKSDQEDK